MPIQKVINKGRVPVKIYTDEIEHEALQQLLNIARLPFVHSHVAAMHRRDGGFGDSVQKRDYPGSSRGGYRLRYECGAAESERRTIAG